MIPHEDAEFVSHIFSRQEESPLDGLDLEEDFPKSAFSTCLLCNIDATLEAYYFKDYAGPYCSVCFDYIVGRLEKGDE